MFNLSPETEARAQASKQKASSKIFLIWEVLNLDRKTEFLNDVKTKRKGIIYDGTLKTITHAYYCGDKAQW